MSYNQLIRGFQQLHLQNQSQSAAANSEEDVKLPANYKKEENIKEFQNARFKKRKLTAETVPEPMDVSSNFMLEAFGTDVKAAAAALDLQKSCSKSDDGPPKKKISVRLSNQSASAGMPSSISQFEFVPAPENLIKINSNLKAAIFRFGKGCDCANCTASSSSKRDASSATSGSSRHGTPTAASSSGTTTCSARKVRTVSRRLFKP